MVMLTYHQVSLVDLGYTVKTSAFQYTMMTITSFELVTHLQRDHLVALQKV